jgi:hypothetical protein
MVGFCSPASNPLKVESLEYCNFANRMESDKMTPKYDS